ncbi:hypothetical protein [Halorhodospira halophila]|uniref:hypothetical protein n=1 Tax=Halorhodospira halophila TaxID=1053 RepID=UPI0019137E59|nr:hypothetical protein [Halorhodospira halophila]MBK5935780.1 hypothetical protein [Halorhodospira halophila]
MKQKVRTSAFILGAGLILGGCASTETTTVSFGDGAEGTLIDCSGWRLGVSDCIEVANERCEGDYEVIASTAEQWQARTGVTGLLADLDRAMIVRCADE